MNNKGFTFIELMIAIVILGVLAAFISGNFITSLKKGRDTRRKADMQNVQRALELYYEDNRAYPASLNFGSSLCHPNGCSTKAYMQQLPADQNGNFSYQYDSDGTQYKLYSCIENDQDLGPGVSQSGYAGTNCSCSPSSACKFGISSPNTTL